MENNDKSAVDENDFVTMTDINPIWQELSSWFDNLYKVIGEAI